MIPLLRIALLSLFVLPLAAAMAAPFGYSVNSDEPNGDSLYRIDLATGVATLAGKVQSGGSVRIDVEGLAFDNAGVLWGIDEDSLRLFPLSLADGQVVTSQEVPIVGLGAPPGSADFGMSFTCSGELFITTVGDQSLYRLTLNGAATKVGTLGVNISSLAAIGNPTRLFGLGNGLISDVGPQDNRSLYEIDPNTGAATLIGSVGAGASDYLQAGLSFDNTGQLWAITDRRNLPGSQGSEILALNLANGAATLSATTTVTGFESLAVSPPANCSPPTGPGPNLPFFPIPVMGTPGLLLAIALIALLGAASLRRKQAS